MRKINLVQKIKDCVKIGKGEEPYKFSKLFF
jgi:hypothetical protein